jgi:hypothetical protein
VTGKGFSEAFQAIETLTQLRARNERPGALDPGDHSFAAQKL